ncbi:hypothetical protein F4782DRAFT_132821 [Xylaria castorea]|nr:hypothetical protein F4782DRAFT_132821 [Xylaria castorea]
MAQGLVVVGRLGVWSLVLSHVFRLPLHLHVLFPVEMYMSLVWRCDTGSCKSKLLSGHLTEQPVGPICASGSVSQCLALDWAYLVVGEYMLRFFDNRGPNHLMLVPDSFTMLYSGSTTQICATSAICSVFPDLTWIIDTRPPGRLMVLQDRRSDSLQFLEDKPEGTATFLRL